MSALDALTRTKTLAPAPVVAADTPNPANTQAQEAEPRVRRVPMSAPVRRLEVDPIPGMHLHWFNADKVARAKQAGYRKMKSDEVFVNGLSIGGDNELGGNTDLGTDVSIVVAADENGVHRQYLMGLPEEFWLEDKAALDERNARIMRDIFDGESIGTDANGRPTGRPDHSYVGQAQIESGGGQVVRQQDPIINRGPQKAQRVRGGRSRAR